MLSSPSIVPGLEDRDVYLVLDNFGGRLGRAWSETDAKRADRAHQPRDTRQRIVHGRLSTVVDRAD